MTRPMLTPCLLCEKAVLYLLNDPNAQSSTNLNGASDIRIIACAGSEFDSNEYRAVICDDCLDKAIQAKRVRFIKEHPPFG